jgi:polyisoprenoid-binding protein YceI
MNHIRISGKCTPAKLAALGACAALLASTFLLGSAPARAAMPQAGPPQGQQRGGRRMPPPPPKPFPLTLSITEGTNASYRVREQLVGITFPSDAVGSSTAVTGQIVFNKDGSIDSAKSKLTFDMRTLKSDQPMRDGFIQQRTLETAKYPDAVFVPKTISGMPNPLNGQFGFELSGDMTIHGATQPVTWQGIATVDTRTGLVAGRATTDFKFETFGMSPPKIFRVMSVNDNIELAVEFHFKIG